MNQEKISYSFTPVPRVYFCCDLNCRSVLSSLIQLSSYCSDENGWFFRTNADLESQTCLSQNVLVGALDALYQKGLIDIIPQQKGKGKKQLSRIYKVHFEKFKEYESIPFEETFKNEAYSITTSDYKGKRPSWMTSATTSVQASTLTSTPTSVHTSLQSDNNIDNKDIIDIKTKINNIDIIKDTLLDKDTNLTSSNEVIDSQGLETSECDSNNKPNGTTALTHTSTDTPELILQCVEYFKAHGTELIQNRNEDDYYTNAAYEIIAAQEKPLCNWIVSIKDNRPDSATSLENLSNAISVAVQKHRFDAKSDLKQTIMDLLIYQSRAEASWMAEYENYGSVAWGG